MIALVTGGAGFIGSHIVELLHENHSVRVLDNLDTGRRSNLDGFKMEFIQGSILDRQTVRAAVEGVDHVFHLAAKVGVPESMSDPIGYNQVNVQGTLMLLEEAARAGVKKLVFSSSCAVYGDNPESPKRETTAPAPKSPYAINKLDGEYYCQMFTAEGRLQTACLRYFNVFGPRQNPESAYAAVVPAFIHRALRNEPITIHGDGEQTRDFIHVKRVAEANAFVATHSSAVGVFNVGSGRGTSINQLAETICRLTNSGSTIGRTGDRPGDVKHSIAATDKLRGLGYDASGDFTQDIQATIASYAH